MKKIVTLLSAITFSVSVFSQQLTYSKVVYDSLGTDIIANSVVQAFDGGYMIIGVSADKGFVVKLDSAGNILWNKRYDVNNSPAFPSVVFTHIIATNDSGYVVCGRVEDS